MNLKRVTIGCLVRKSPVTLPHHHWLPGNHVTPPLHVTEHGTPYWLPSNWQRKSAASNGLVTWQVLSAISTCPVELPASRDLPIVNGCAKEKYKLGRFNLRA